MRCDRGMKAPARSERRPELSMQWPRGRLDNPLYRHLDEGIADGQPRRLDEEVAWLLGVCGNMAMLRRWAARQWPEHLMYNGGYA